MCCHYLYIDVGMCGEMGDISERRLEECFIDIKKYVRQKDEEQKAVEEGKIEVERSLYWGEVLGDLRKVWRGLEQCTGLVEARTRLVLAKLEKPVLASAPDWLKNQVKELKQEERAARYDCELEQAQNLVQSCLALEGYSHLEADISYGPLGSVVVDWDVRGRHQWMIVPLSIPWPAVKNYVLHREGSGLDARREQSCFHDAFEVIDYFKEKLVFAKKLEEKR